jgi:uncharacterized protein (DUF342 family)
MADPDEPEELETPNPEMEESAGIDGDAVEPIPASIRFSRQGLDNNLLVITVEPDEGFFAGIAVREIEDWISRQGCEGWFFHEETIQLISREARRLDRIKEYVVAERKDCRVDIQVSSDRLHAWIRVSPAYGGTPVTEDLIRKTLQEHHITVGIRESLIQQIIQDGECDRELIAEGTSPKPGQPVKFEPLVHESEHKGVPQEREYGRVDYKDLGLFLSVKEGTPLLRHIPPTEGSPGVGVDGMPIPAPPAVDRAPHPGIGTAFSKEDPEVIVATRAGQPYFFENSVRVDPTLEIDSVGPSTGNVQFEGNVMVRGPVESGYEVNAGQDLTILDTVEGARLTAGRNLNLLTGVYGKGKSIILATGNIEARFLSDCQVRCGGNIEVADLINHCNVECEGFIYIGKSGGKGQAFGGRLVAMRGIQAQILGSVSEAATQLELAPPQALLLRLGKAEEESDATRKALEITEKNLQALKDAHPDGDDSRQRTLEEKMLALREKIEALKSEIAILEEKVNAPRKGKIKAAEVHRGVTLRIGKGREIVSDLINDLCYQEPAEKKPREEGNREDAKDAKKRKD